MKKTGILAAIALLLLIAISVAHSQTDRVSAGPCGRYQISDVEFDSFTSKGTARVKSVFKIDTQTGQVWIWNEGLDADNKLTEKWVLTE